MAVLETKVKHFKSWDELKTWINNHPSIIPSCVICVPEGDPDNRTGFVIIYQI